MTLQRLAPWIVFALRLTIGGIFIAAGALKVGHADLFAAEIAGFRIGFLPQAAIGPMAIALPYLEMLVGAYLVLGLFTRISGFAAAVLLGVFDLAIASAVVRGLTVSCGCFGPNDTTTTSWSEVARDAIFVALALVIALRPPGALALDRRIGIHS